MNERSKNYLDGSKRYAIDTSVLIKYYYDQTLFNDEFLSKLVVSEVTLSEVFYILCRKEGPQKAQNFTRTISTKLEIIPSHKLIMIAANLKCQCSIALADCWTLAAAINENIEALFAFRENELVNNLDLIQNYVSVVFLDTLI